MTYPTVEIGSNPYTVYDDLAAADAYMDAALHADTWRSSDTDAKGRAMVTAVRTIDRQGWKGTKTDAGQEHAFPRDDMGTIDGVEDGVIPERVKFAQFEMALALLDGSEVQNQENTVEKLSSLSAGSVSLTFYHGADGSVKRFPQIVNELLAPLLSGAGSTLQAPQATGYDGESVTRQNFGFNRGL